MSDWPFKDPDEWEPVPDDDSNDTKNGRLMNLLGTAWIGKEINVIKWMTNYDPPRWAMWEKHPDNPSEPT